MYATIFFWVIGLFSLGVIALPVNDGTTSLAARQSSYAGYLFAYFTGEGTSTGERIYFSISNGNDPLNWLDVKGGASILTSTLGTQGLRDPTVIRSQDGSKFFLIATDLKIYGNGNWDAAQRTGSRSIAVWESTDLVNWGTQRLVQVSPATAGNTWAPEAVYDPSISAYRVFWASKIYASSDTGHTGTSYNRILAATTTDFRTFTTAQTYIDYGYSVIDTTIVQDGSTFYRFSKDERSNSSSAPNGKFVFQERSSSITGSWSSVAVGIGKGSITQGEGPTVFKSNTQTNRWYMFIDENGGRGYVPFYTDSISSGSWTLASSYSLPTRPRHGSVVPITAAELARLKAL